MLTLLNRFVPHPDVRKRYSVRVRAPAEIVLEVARTFDMDSIALVHALVWLRAKLLGAKAYRARRMELVDGMLDLGWGRLAEGPGRYFAAGASCQPWLADVVFEPAAPESFADYREPGRVKIAWTLEVESLGPGQCRLASETRAVATDEQSRKKFRAYWRKFGIGIVLIRRLLLPAIGREAERRWRQGLTAAASPNR